jgi:hypothetical protein
MELTRPLFCADCKIACTNDLICTGFALVTHSNTVTGKACRLYTQMPTGLDEYKTPVIPVSMDDCMDECKTQDQECPMLYYRNHKKIGGNFVTISATGGSDECALKCCPDPLNDQAACRGCTGFVYNEQGTTVRWRIPTLMAAFGC